MQWTRPLKLAAAIALAVAGLALLAMGVRATHSDRILPGVRVEGVGLGGLSDAEARRRLAPLAREAAEQPLSLPRDDRRLTLDPAEAGYVVDVPRTIARAKQSGRGGPLGGLWSTVAGLFGHRDLPLVERVDRARLRRAVASVAGRLGSGSLAGALVIDPQTLAVSTKPPRPGRVVDRPKLRSRLAPALLRRPRETVEVPLKTRPVASRAAVEAVGRAAQRVSRAAAAADRAPASRSRSHRPSSRACWRSSRATAAGRCASARATQRVAALVDQIAAKRDRPARDARIDAPARVVTFDDKDDASWRPRAADVDVVGEARPGRTVQRKQLAAEIEAAIREGRHAIELPTAARRARRLRRRRAPDGRADRHLHDVLRPGPAARDEHQADRQGRRRDDRRPRRALLAERRGR